jgi:hypothetical protein
VVGVAERDRLFAGIALPRGVGGIRDQLKKRSSGTAKHYHGNDDTDPG